MSPTQPKVDVARDFDAFRERVTALQSVLPRRLLQVAEFVLRHPDETALGTAASIAERAQVQPSTVVRFAQTLGYQGFSELQDVFKSRIRDRWPSHPERLQRLHSAPTGSPEADLHGFAAAAHTSLDRFMDASPAQGIGGAVDILAGARTVFIAGTRRSYPAVDYLAYAFGTLGVAALPIDSMSGQARERGDLAQADDAMIAVSFSPYAPPTADIATAAAQRGVALIAITDSPLAPLARLARITIEVVEADYAGFRSLAATFVAANTLAAATAARRQALRTQTPPQAPLSGRSRSRHRRGSAP